MAKYTDEQIIEILKNLAESLGKKTLTKKDVASVIPTSTINYRFGNLGNALDAAGLKKTDTSKNLVNRKTLTDDDLFKALYEIERKIGREPKHNECNAHCKYSVQPYRKRYGKWKDVISLYRKWKVDNEQKHTSIHLNGVIVNDKELNNVESVEEAIPPPTVSPVGTSRKKDPQQLYGEPIDFRGFRHAPINEQGVVFLFGMVSRELGFNIESIQQGFPDCEGKYLHDKKKDIWAKARIEIEYKASNFQKHAHDPNECDFIVCWTNDWPNCPVNVIELKTEILKLPSR